MKSCNLLHSEHISELLLSARNACFVGGKFDVVSSVQTQYHVTNSELVSLKRMLIDIIILGFSKRFNVLLVYLESIFNFNH